MSSIACNEAKERGRPETQQRDKIRATRRLPLDPTKNRNTSLYFY